MSCGRDVPTVRAMPLHVPKAMPIALHHGKIAVLTQEMEHHRRAADLVRPKDNNKWS